MVLIRLFFHKGWLWNIVIFLFSCLVFRCFVFFLVEVFSLFLYILEEISSIAGLWVLSEEFLRVAVFHLILVEGGDFNFVWIFSLFFKFGVNFLFKFYSDRSWMTDRLCVSFIVVVVLGLSAVTSVGVWAKSKAVFMVFGGFSRATSRVFGLTEVKVPGKFRGLSLSQKRWPCIFLHLFIDTAGSWLFEVDRVGK